MCAYDHQMSVARDGRGGKEPNKRKKGISNWYQLNLLKCNPYKLPDDQFKAGVHEGSNEDQIKVLEKYLESGPAMKLLEVTFEVYQPLR